MIAWIFITEPTILNGIIFIVVIRLQNKNLSISLSTQIVLMNKTKQENSILQTNTTFMLGTAFYGYIN
jgi:hypothetical protein